MVMAAIKLPMKCSAVSKLIQLQLRMLAAKATATTCGERFKDSACDRSEKSKKQPKPSEPAKENPETEIKRSLFCCGDHCPGDLPRFDKLYYRRSDKAQRSYQQTWNECAEVFVKPKNICTKIIKPKLEKRRPEERPQTACKQDVCLQSKTKCPYIKMPRCKVGRKPPSCLEERSPSKCTKRTAPHPSFSECKFKKRKTSAIECDCLTIPSICDVWAHHRRQMAIKRKRC